MLEAPPLLERSDLRLVGPVDPRDAVAPISLDDRLTLLAAQAKVSLDDFQGLPIDPESGQLLGEVAHSRPGTVLLLVTSNDTAYLCMEPDERGFRDVTRRGQTAFAQVPVAGRRGLSIVDGEKFRARIVNGCVTVDPTTGAATVDEEKISRGQVPVLKPIELELAYVPGRVVETAGVVDGEKSRVLQRMNEATRK
jgi:hypothetical protein